MAEDGRGNGARAEGLWTRRAACLHRPRHIPRLVRRPSDKPGQHRTQKVRRGGGNREILPTRLTSTVLAGRRPIAGEVLHGHAVECANRRRAALHLCAAPGSLYQARIMEDYVLDFIPDCIYRVQQDWS
jgi:hypothetical protein